MPKVIIYPDTDESGAPTGGVRVVHPVGGCGLTIEDIARKDVPQGASFKIIDAAELPADRTFRAAWEADFSAPDGFGDPDGWWAEQAEREAAEQASREAALASIQGEQPE
ncbi:hypothetical protein [Sphingobium tyrosinilyticum]|uniref:Uncharacterized protein n=1 Tax=Sphingobium tyrosinilyticum TaxID=2715436 RepID=A0ABV9EZ80_9SPHN